MPVLLKDRLIMLVPKAASTSLRRAAGEAGGRQYGDCHDTLEQVREKCPDLAWSESVAMIRHPLDTIVSLWLMQSRLYPMDGGFKWFLEHYETHVYMPGGRLYLAAEGVDRIFLYEQMQEIEQYLGISLPHLNKAKQDRGPYQEYYDEDAYTIARQRFHIDFEIYASVAEGVMA